MEQTDLNLLEKLCAIPSPSGRENVMKDYLLEYIDQHKKSWKCIPEIFQEGIQDCLMLVFGKPRTAVFAHMDTVGFMVRYQDQLVPIGSPSVVRGTRLVGMDHLGWIDCGIRIDHDRAYHTFQRGIETGTTLSFKPEFRQTGHSIQSPYLDNRVGIWNALKLAETLQDGILIFSSMEELGGGTVSYLSRIIYEKFNISQALISDVTWATDGVIPGNGVVISLRDRHIPRQTYIDRILSIATASGIWFQPEVESDGSSDGGEIQKSPYPVDWAFIGIAEEHVHSRKERIHNEDPDQMLALYQKLMIEL